MPHQIRITSGEGVEVLARLIYRGDSYGRGRQLVNTGYGTLIEFALPRGSREELVAVYNVDDLPTEVEGWMPGGVHQLAMTRAETERLLRWIEDPESETDAVALLVGDEAELDKASVALKRLGMTTRREADGGRAATIARTSAPTVVVVGHDTGSLSPHEVVRRLAAGRETSDVPTVLFGVSAGDANGASLSVAAGDYKGLVSGVSELLDLV